jgi:tetratricopeptide (TPR) repeat protein
MLRVSLSKIFFNTQITTAKSQTVITGSKNMKRHYASAFVIAGLLGAMPAHANTTVGQTPADACFNAAQTVSRSGNALLDVLNRQALASCTEALSNKMNTKDRIATLVNRGTIESASGDFTASLADYDAALAMNPKMADIYINRGTALMRAARYEDARASFDKAVSLGGTNIYIAYLNRAMAEEKSGNINGAYQDYKQAVALAPDYQPAKNELARFQTVVRPKQQS